jgi:hypothetical protein
MDVCVQMVSPGSRLFAAAKLKKEEPVIRSHELPKLRTNDNKYFIRQVEKHVTGKRQLVTRGCIYIPFFIPLVNRNDCIR